MAAHTVARLPLIDPAIAPQPIAETFKLLPDINLFRVMANGGPLFTAYMKFLDLLFRPMELNSSLNECSFFIFPGAQTVSTPGG